MKQKFLKTFTLALCFLFFLKTASADAATYYVCNNAMNCNTGSSGWSLGNDSNNGTAKSTPWLNPQKCADTMVAGDTCIVGKGTYTDVGSNSPVIWSVGKYGTAGNPITYQSEQLHGAVLDGQNIGLAIIGIYPYYCLPKAELSEEQKKLCKKQNF